MSGAATVRGWARDIKSFADDWPRHGAVALQHELDAALRADTGGDGALSHARDLGAASVEIDASPGEADVNGAGAMAVWVMLEHGTRAHKVAAPKGRTLNTPYGPRPFVHVSGMRAKRTWTRGLDRGMPAVERDAEQAWSKVGA